MDALNKLISDLKNITESVEIKYKSRAIENETVDSQRTSDLYMSAKLEQDTFNTYQNFDTEAIIMSGINDISLAKKYAEDKFLIPDTLRDTVIKNQRKYIIDNYVEMNDYYRMLNGLPNYYNDTHIYLSDSIYDLLGIQKIAVHELDPLDIYKLEKQGLLDDLKLKHPDARYLHYLGNKKIPIEVSRPARNFSIIHMTSDLHDHLYEEFNSIYELCREYYMTVLYIPDYGKRFDYYDNFMAMMIMVMSIQRLVSNNFKYGIQNDFYDLDSLQMLFESYNVPFIENLPIEYQREIARNLNVLLHYKSTDKVLFDICSILGFERINILKYYLVRDHKLDVDAKPIFKYKEETRPDGTIAIVEDTEEMYELYFQQVDLNERNLTLALTDTSNRLDYDQVVMDDPYWWNEDTELKEKLYDEEFNYVETKYLNMNIMYKLTEMLFEVMYVFRMLLDKKQDTTSISIQLPKLFGNKKIDLFNITIFMCALISKRNGFKGDIISTPTKTLSILGFNFKTDLKEIRKIVMDNAPLLDPKLLEFVTSSNLNTAEDINKLFANIRDLEVFLSDKIANTQNIKEYHLYKKIYKMLMVTEDSQELYRKKDGTVAQTFIDYLEDSDEELFRFVSTCTTNELTDAMDHIIARLSSTLSELKHIYILNDTNNAILQAVITLIKFFKSYTTELGSFNILYLMNSRHFNMIKMIGDISIIRTAVNISENGLKTNYNDFVALEGKIVGRNDISTTENIQSIISTHIGKSAIDFEDYGKLHTMILNKISINTIYNDVVTLDSILVNNDNSRIKELVYSLIIEHAFNEKIRFQEELKILLTTFLIQDKEVTKYNDIVLLNKIVDTITEDMDINDIIATITTQVFNNDNISLHDKVNHVHSQLSIVNDANRLSSYRDSFLQSGLSRNLDRIGVYDKIKLIREE